VYIIRASGELRWVSNKSNDSWILVPKLNSRRLTSSDDVFNGSLGERGRDYYPKLFDFDLSRPSLFAVEPRI